MNNFENIKIVYRDRTVKDIGVKQHENFKYFWYTLNTMPYYG